MGEWSQFTVTEVLAAMPTDMTTLYVSWIDANPTKNGRLSALVAETRSIFRQAVAVNPSCELDEDENTVPLAGFRHALNMVFFNLGMEMGMPFAASVYSLVTRSDIWLRMVESGSINPVSVDGGTPSYEPADRTEGIVA